VACSIAADGVDLSDIEALWANREGVWAGGVGNHGAACLGQIGDVEFVSRVDGGDRAAG
jgi:hypothetical protein